MPPWMLNRHPLPTYPPDVNNLIFLTFLPRESGQRFVNNLLFHCDGNSPSQDYQFLEYAEVLKALSVNIPYQNTYGCKREKQFLLDILEVANDLTTGSWYGNVKGNEISKLYLILLFMKIMNERAFKLSVRENPPSE